MINSWNIGFIISWLLNLHHPFYCPLIEFEGGADKMDGLDWRLHVYVYIRLWLCFAKLLSFSMRSKPTYLAFEMWCIEVQSYKGPWEFFFVIHFFFCFVDVWCYIGFIYHIHVCFETVSSRYEQEPRSRRKVQRD